MNSSISTFRKRRASQRVYVPHDARYNHYIIAEMPLTDELIELAVGKVDLSLAQPFQNFYQTLAKLAFEVVEESDIEHVNFVANGRLIRVRSSSNEQMVLHTPQQSFFFYNPEHNSTFKGYFDGAYRANKIKFVFLATGDELRINSASFHQKASEAIESISKRIGLEANSFKIRDHQHISYDMFAKEKGNKESIAHSFRKTYYRHLQQGHKMPEQHDSVAFAVINFPITGQLFKGIEIDHEAKQPFASLYEKVADAFTDSAEKHKLNHAAMIANNMSPIVRYDENEAVVVDGEIITLGFNPHNEESSIDCKWHGDKLADTIHLVFFANDSDEDHKTYDKFVSQVTQAVTLMAEKLQWKKGTDDMLMRFHQHVTFRI
ncbi:MAG: DUF3083 family protein [Colwellia sp.]|nr:DUF3083 family protein [Colwellia sp.]MCW8863729.1 DUF3083 family protein [Colwellia sp.]MCW9081368.1 DUF3083 family protein [Colwellia sp.]